MLFFGWLSCASDPVGPTYHADVAPILAEHCGACHQDGSIAPFSVLSYESAKDWAEPMLASVEGGRMPPWFATESEECDQRIGFVDDPRLDESEKETLRAWIDAGAPEGEPGEAPRPPEIDHLEEVDLDLAIPQPYEVNGLTDIYQCFRIPLDIPQDRWITGVEVVPDNERVVHHVLVWSDPLDLSAERVGPDGSYPCSGTPDFFPTEIAAIWTPGTSPTRAPPDAGTLVHPGGSIVVNIHYHPTGLSAEVDQTRVRLSLREDQPSSHTTWFLVDSPFGAEVQPGPGDESGPIFEIPAGQSAHQETVALTIPDFIPFDLKVFAITPHMHYLGTDMLVKLRYASGAEECLVHTPGYRFDFQTMYTYDTSDGPWPTASVGDTIEVRCTYDNSTSNPFMPLHLSASGASEPHDVYWGEETGDEMCMAMVGLVLPPVDWLALF